MNIVNGPVINNQTHEHLTSSTVRDNNFEKVKKIINIISVKKRTAVNRNISQKDNECHCVIRMRYGRIVLKLDRLAY